MTLHKSDGEIMNIVFDCDRAHGPQLAFQFNSPFVIFKNDIIARPYVVIACVLYRFCVELLLGRILAW